MIQFSLFFALGFLAAGFLALLIAPAIWRRAVFLTRKRIESAIPLTANELQADKDKLRAEHAMAIRKVEIALDKQRAKATAQATQINDFDAEVKLLKAENAAQIEAQRQIEKTLSMTTGNLSTREDELQDLKFQLSTTAAELSARTGELESLTRLYQERELHLSDAAEREKQNELQLSKLATTVADLKSKRLEDQAKMREIRVEGKATEELLKNERARAREVAKKYEQIIAVKSDVDEKLARREKEIGRLRDKRLDEDASAQELEQRLMYTEAERIALEKEVGELTLQLNKIEKAVGSENPEKAMDALHVRSAKLELDLKAARDESDALKRKLSSSSAAQAVQSLSAKPPTTKSGDDDALLREQLKQLAAEVVHMTALVEGDGSRINMLIKNAQAGASGDVISLAERIKALKDAARAAE